MRASGRDNTNGVAGGDPLDGIAWPNPIVVGNGLRYRDLQFARYFRHVLTIARIQSLFKFIYIRPQLWSLLAATKEFGEEKPAAPNTKPDGSDDLEGRQKNRRVEIILKKN